MSRLLELAVLSLTLVLLLAVPLAAADKAGSSVAAQKTARDALAKLAEVWKKPSYENGAGLSEVDDPVWKVRMESLVVLAKAGPDAIPVLVDALKNGPPASRILAAQAL